MADNNGDLPQRKSKTERQATQAETARIERVLATAREAEGSIGGRPGRENGDWTHDR